MDIRVAIFFSTRHPPFRPRNPFSYSLPWIRLPSPVSWDFRWFWDPQVISPFAKLLGLLSVYRTLHCTSISSLQNDHAFYPLLPLPHLGFFGTMNCSEVCPSAVLSIYAWKRAIFCNYRCRREREAQSKALPTVACNRYNVFDFRIFLFVFPAIPIKPSIPTGSMKCYQTCLGRTKHWRVHRLAIGNYCICQIRIYIASATSRLSRIRGTSQTGWSNAELYILSSKTAAKAKDRQSET